jgi:glycosyltransferase involved in cell wall biosynthesis
MKVATDNRIFKVQKFGGISRQFKDYLDEGVIHGVIDVENNKKSNYRSNRFLHKFQKSWTQTAQSVNELIDGAGFDLYHPSYYGSFDPHKLNTPYVITVYDMIHELYPEIFDINQTSNEKNGLLPSARRIIAISETTKRDIIKCLNLDANKIDVVPLYTNFHKFSSIEVNAKFPAKYILYVGGRGIYKNFKRFIESFKRITENNKKINVICTGQEFNKHEIEYFSLMGLKERLSVIQCKNDQEMKFLYENAECLVFPSLYEGFGFPILEAFASRCAVVSSFGGALSEVGGDACVYFDPLDIDDMADKLELILNDTYLRNENIEKGSFRLNCYSIEKTMNLTNEVYKKACSE